jgi:hypothetical protein
MPSPRRAYEFGDVVGVREFGNRPAVVVSSTAHNRTAEDVVIMLITTKDRHSVRGGAIALGRWRDYGLDRESVIKPVLASRSPDDLVLYGKVDAAVKQQLRESLATIFGGTVRKKPHSGEPRSIPQN